MSGWQGMETAPRDGTRFLAYYEGARTTTIIHRHDPGGAERHPRHNYECWVGDNHKRPVLIDEPTHWMPLPEPPAASAVDRGGR